MAKVRSPNYPVLALTQALDAIRPAFRAENRNKMSRAVLAKHLGYNSLNGRALGKIGAVRAYGLIDGSGDDLRISDDAVIALNAPQGSEERLSALARLSMRSTLFQQLRKDFPDTLPSLDNLKFTLIKRQFTPEAAEKAAKSYLATMSLVLGVPNSYAEPSEGEETETEFEAKSPLRSDPKKKPLVSPPLQMQKAQIMEGERELTTGLLSKGSSFRLIVNGHIGVKEIETLIKKLEIDKDILADTEADEAEEEGSS